MKSTIKKGLLSLGTATAIAMPIAAVISCGTTKNTINWKDDDKYGEVDGKQFLSEIKHLGKTKQKAITVAKEQMVQVQYESESIRSLETQRDIFKFNNWKTSIDINKLNNDQSKVEEDLQSTEDSIKDEKDEAVLESLNSSKTAYEGQIESIKASVTDKTKEINDTQKFIDAINDAIDGIDFGIDFISTTDKITTFFTKEYNSTDYPQVYKPLAEIKDDKTKIVNDAYRNFYPQFTTREDGDKEWPTELAKNYGDAATFSQAIDYLITNEISEKAFGLFKFDITKTYNVEQKIWSEYIDKNAFKFLTTNGSQHASDIEEDYKSIIGDGKEETIKEHILNINSGEKVESAGKIIAASVLSSPEIFLGSKSPDYRIPTEAYDTLGHVVKYQHLLVKATQGTAPSDLWTITADDLTKLMTFKQVEKTDDTGKEVKQGISFIYNDDLFKTDLDIDKNDKLKDMTDFILKEVSGNSEGTLKIQGSLGVKPELEYIKTMVPGFSLGNLANGQQGAVPEIDLSVLTERLRKALQIEISKNHVDDLENIDASNMDQANVDIAATIKDLGDDKVKTIFGRVFSEFFAQYKDFVYSVKGTSNFMVISQFGIHIIRETRYDNPNNVKETLTQDIESMADDSSLPSTTGLATELGTVYTDTKIMGVLLENKEFEETLEEKLTKYNEDKQDDVDKIELTDVKKLIEDTNKLKSKTDIDEAMGDKLEKWLVTQLDSGLRELQHKTTLDDIYSWAEEIEEGKVK